ncbi:MAG: DUF3362 domain-containing protein, partial [Pseudomonadota bacterium]|nr:DUF3362 domain-containing protein [Pseudomonadota bacterium]
RDSETVDIVKGEKRRRLHKAFLRYHDPNNWPLLREALKSMGRADLIGNGRHQLIPTNQPVNKDGEYQSARKKNSSQEGDSVKRNSATSAKGQRMQPQRPSKGRVLTQHTGLPPRSSGKKRQG